MVVRVGALRVRTGSATAQVPESAVTTRTGAVASAPPATDAQARIAELEHLLELEQSRRIAIEQGLERISERCSELAKENLTLRAELGRGDPVPGA